MAYKISGIIVLANWVLNIPINTALKTDNSTIKNTKPFASCCAFLINNFQRLIYFSTTHCPLYTLYTHFIHTLYTLYTHTTYIYCDTFYICLFYRNYLYHIDMYVVSDQTLLFFSILGCYVCFFILGIILRFILKLIF